MKIQFVNYDIAVKLKELGFNEKCLAYFRNKDEIIIENDLNMSFMLQAPLWQQVIDWFREKYKINISVTAMGEDWNEYYLTQIEPFKALTTPVAYQTYSKARKQAILKTIELCKNNS